MSAHLAIWLAIPTLVLVPVLALARAGGLL